MNTIKDKDQLPIFSFENYLENGASQHNENESVNIDNVQLHTMYGFSNSKLKLNKEQFRAAKYDAIARNILVKAGAGCGKTSTIVARAEHLISTGIDPKRILLITFTNRAAKEIMDRIHKQIDYDTHKIFAGTFHGFCLAQLKKNQTAFGISGTTIIEDDDVNALFTLVKQKTLLKYPENDEIKHIKSSKLSKFYSYIRNTGQNPSEYLKKNVGIRDESLPIVNEIFQGYSEAKKDRQYIDFDDMLEIFSHKLGDNADLRKRILGDYEEVLVDEFQDTNPLQFEILNHFVTEKVRLFCVGDPAQSIYGFRGAQFDKIIGFTETFKNSIELPLSENYRSPQSILDLANWLLFQSPLDYNSQLTSPINGQGSKPQLVTLKSNESEAEFIAGTIQLKVDTGRQYSDHMILVRTNRDAKHIEVELLKQKIPYILIGGGSLIKLAHVRDIISVLRIVRNRSDELAWVRYLKMWPKIGNVKAQNIYSDFVQDTDNVLEVLNKHVGKNHKLVQGYWDVLAKSKINPQKAVQATLDLLSDYIRISYENWQSRSSDLKLMVETASRFSNLDDYVEMFMMNPKSYSQLREDDSNVVRLTTVHSAKGTEAPICFVSAVNTDRYPNYNCEDLAEVEEDRRVLYVAVTRAKEELLVTRVIYNQEMQIEDSNPNYFLRSIPSGLVKEINIDDLDVRLTG